MMITAHNQNFVMDSRGWERETERVCVREGEREKYDDYCTQPELCNG